MRVLLALITVGITIYAVVDCLRSTDEEVRNLPRPLWLLITLVPLTGGLAWLAFGRPSAEQPVRRTGHHPPAPDDDPEFLRSLDRTFRERRRQVAEEARRRRREEEARRQTEEAKNREARRGGRAAGRSGDGKPGDGQSGNGKSGTGKTGTGKTGNGTSGDGKTGNGEPGDDRQTPA